MLQQPRNVKSPHVSNAKREMLHAPEAFSAADRSLVRHGMRCRSQSLRVFFRNDSLLCCF
jgi:hypothetical protein